MFLLSLRHAEEAGQDELFFRGVFAAMMNVDQQQISCTISAGVCLARPSSSTELATSRRIYLAYGHHTFSRLFSRDKYQKDWGVIQCCLQKESWIPRPRNGFTFQGDYHEDGGG